MPQNPKNIRRLRRRFNQNQWFYSFCWLLPEADFVLSFFHRLVTILQSKTLIFQCRTQNPSPKSQNFRLRRTGLDTVTVLPPCSKIGKTREGKTVRGETVTISSDAIHRQNTPCCRMPRNKGGVMARGPTGQKSSPLRRDISPKQGGGGYDYEYH